MQKTIDVQNARENNLKNVSVKLPRDKLIVVTGVSGSGKSSLAFDTVYRGRATSTPGINVFLRETICGTTQKTGC